MANLWEEKIPYYDTVDEDKRIVPQIEAYPANSSGAVIVFAGGAYCGRAEHEGRGYAKWLQSIGITSFVVDYRVAPYKHPTELSDAMRAVKYVRFYADRYGIKSDKIAVMGSSAGGHLAGSVSVHYDKKMYDDTDRIDRESCRPDASILCYPVIDMGKYRHEGSLKCLMGDRYIDRTADFMSLHKQINENTPEAFLWHTSTDQAVPAMNSLLYAEGLAKNGIDYELHIYPMGHHGLGLAPDMPYVGKWASNLREWLLFKGWK